jgi:Uma2 family endonuclease
MTRPALAEPGPFRAWQLTESDRYELDNGHLVECQPSGLRHSTANVVGAAVLDSDPAVTGQVAMDLGIAFNDDRSLRAPDIAVGVTGRGSGWYRSFPPLAIEYADTGQDEVQLAKKIAELLAGGTRLVWVVRLIGPLRVEVYAPNDPVRLIGPDEELTAPGILHNPVPVRALVDPEVAREVTLRNRLLAHGYASLSEVRAEGREQGLAEGLVAGHAAGRVDGHTEGETAGLLSALLTVLSARGLIPGDAEIAELRRCRDAAILRRWLAAAATAAVVADVFAATARS